MPGADSAQGISGVFQGWDGVDTVRVRIPASLQPYDPVRIGPFKVVGRLGAGAMGQVYLARSPSSRLVAVKTIRADMAMDADYRRRFAREVTAARRVSGAFTAAVVDADTEAELPWLATVYLPAPSLAALVEACGPLPVPAIRWLAAGCAEALECIHQAGLVHRDLKPGNVLVEADGPKVIDFGLARADGLSHLTGSGDVMGTPSFMAPEQAAGGGLVGTAADVYSLGATLLYAATGHSPYRAKSGPEAVLLLLSGKPDLTGVPDGLRAMLAGCLAADPADRPTPAALVEYHAPYLLAGADSAPPLPAAALRLIEEYGRGPHALAPDEDEQDWDVELDRFLGRLPAHPSLSPGHGGFFHTSSRAVRRGRQAGLIGVGAALVVAGVAGGLFYGSHQVGAGRSAQAAMASSAASPTLPPLVGSLSGQQTGQQSGQQTAPPPGSPPSGQPAGAPPGLPPGMPPPPPGAIWQSNGVVLTVGPPYGDQNTTFILRGTGWPPGKSVTVSFVGGRTSPLKPVVDNSGMFFYAVNEQHEFFDGAIPPGTYQVQASVGSLVGTVNIVVNPTPGI